MGMANLIPLTDGSVQLRVPARGDLDLHVEWQGVTIVSADADIRGQDGRKVLDLANYMTIVAGAVEVHVPDVIISALDDWGQGEWSLVATSNTGSTKIILEGVAKRRKGAKA